MYMQQVTEYDVTHISVTQPRKNMIMGKVDTSDLMMIITWAMDISYYVAFESGILHIDDACNAVIW